MFWNRRATPRRKHDLYSMTEEVADHISDSLYENLVQVEKEGASSSASSAKAGRKAPGKHLAEELDTYLHRVIKKKIIPQVAGVAARRVRKRLNEDLREQYRAQHWAESACDRVVSNSRWIMAVVYSALALVLLCIASYAVVESFKLAKSTFCYVDQEWSWIDTEWCPARSDDRFDSADPSRDGVGAAAAGASSPSEASGLAGGSDSESESGATTAAGVESSPEFESGSAPGSGAEGSNGYEARNGLLAQAKKKKLLQIITSTVKILDLVLVGSLVVMVLIGGYENTVSRIGMKHSMPVWLGKLTISELKVKVAASVVIISSIHLLEEFLYLDFPTAVLMDPEEYLPLVVTAVVHLVFVFSALAITFINKMETDMHRSEPHPGAGELREEMEARDPSLIVR